MEIYEALGILKKVGRPEKLSPEVTISKADIAEKKLGITRKQLHQDIQLARALDENPELAKCDSKNEALSNP